MKSASEPSNSGITLTLDMSAVGRIKEAPKPDASLQPQAMTSEELSKHCFSVLEIPQTSGLLREREATTSAEDPVPISSSSSLASRESNGTSNSSELGGAEAAAAAAAAPSSSASSCATSAVVKLTPLRMERRHSDQILKVSARKVSRNGRQTQRWSTDPKSHTVYRLVTGCVPIVEGGKILFVSAARKPEWILPKGGWEQDESMEESALRECFEEAGVVGVLGPRLTEVEFETRKSKKRRMEQQQQLQQQAQEGQEDKAKKQKTMLSPTAEEPAPAPETTTPAKKIFVEDVHSLIKASPALTPLVPRKHNWDETSSVASEQSSATTTKGHSHVKMHMYPLYVSEVKSSWPESGRFRKVVDIDEAIEMCEARPELQTVLKEVKEKKLHLLSTAAQEER